MKRSMQTEENLTVKKGQKLDASALGAQCRGDGDQGVHGLQSQLKRSKREIEKTKKQRINAKK